MNIHMNRQNQEDGSAQTEGEIPLEKMKKYIAYCKR